MREGVERFAGDIKAFWQSFIVLGLNFLLIPLSIPFVYEADERLQQASLGFVIFLFLLKMIIVVLALVAFSYFICKLLKREQDFLRYITTSNWVSLIGLILYLPFIVIMEMELANYTELAPYLIVIAIYIYVIVAFVAKYVLKIPWELAGFISICSLAINESFYNTVYMLTGIQ